MVTTFKYHQILITLDQHCHSVNTILLKTEMTIGLADALQAEATSSRAVGLRPTRQSLKNNFIIVLVIAIVLRPTTALWVLPIRKVHI